MADYEFVVNAQGVRSMLGSPEVLALCQGSADKVRATAVGMVSDDEMDNDAFYSSSRKDSKGMARASVYTGNPHGYNACLSDNVLLKALG